jgi:hypothetical protein
MSDSQTEITRNFTMKVLAEFGDDGKFAIYRYKGLSYYDEQMDQLYELYECKPVLSDEDDKVEVDA